MRSLVLRRPKTIRSYGKIVITNVRNASNRMYKNVSKRINKLEMNAVLEGAQKRMKLFAKQGRRWMRLNSRKIARARWYRDMQKGTFFPKRYKLIKRSVNANYSIVRGWVRAQVPKIKNFASRSSTNIADLATTTYSNVEKYVSTRVPKAQRWMANAF